MRNIRLNGKDYKESYYLWAKAELERMVKAGEIESSRGAKSFELLLELVEKAKLNDEIM